MPPGALRFARPPGGLYLWCRLAAGLSATALLRSRARRRRGLRAGAAFYPDPAGDSELRLCFTSVDPDAIDAAIGKLAACLRQVTERATPQRRELRPHRTSRARSDTAPRLRVMSPLPSRRSGVCRR